MSPDPNLVPTDWHAFSLTNLMLLRVWLLSSVSPEVQKIETATRFELTCKLANYIFYRVKLGETLTPVPLVPPPTRHVEPDLVTWIWIASHAGSISNIASTLAEKVFRELDVASRSASLDVASRSASLDASGTCPQPIDTSSSSGIRTAKSPMRVAHMWKVLKRHYLQLVENSPLPPYMKFMELGHLMGALSFQQQ